MSKYEQLIFCSERKQKTGSSNTWMRRHLTDPYVKSAHKEGFLSRAAFKITQINEKYNFLKPGKVVVDLGAAPGGWSQVAAQHVLKGDTGRVIAIDKNEIGRIEGVITLQQDFLDPTQQDKITKLLPTGKADVVLSDMAPSYTGKSSIDHPRLMELANMALEFALKVLVQEGVFVCKMSAGGTEKEFENKLKQYFEVVKLVKPPSSRSESTEFYAYASKIKRKEGTPLSVQMKQ
eukprot:TRINITY_DN2552_c0_g1_i2.p1 TRINITY_DN2552_c0_g1~~TRINITY_DN2552_c0_g1_i2.p1  ORF type:complete len:234 (-),score=64.32 TRINITY_DN2552_c0_g1_i2:84-785(-)